MERKVLANLNKKKTISKKLIYDLIFALIIIVIFTPVIHNQLKTGDYPANIRQTQELASTGYLYLKANLLFHRLVLIVRDVMPYNFLARISPQIKYLIDLKSYDIAAYFVNTAVNVVTGITLATYFSRKFYYPLRKYKSLLPYVAALAILILGPITVFTFPERQFFGYFTGNPVHNAPFTLMKLFGLWFFILVTEETYLQNFKGRLWIATLAIIFATLAKPNYALSMLPAFFIVFFIIRVKEVKKNNLLKLLLPILILPVFILLTQYYIMYTGDRSENILIEPFRVMLLTSPNVYSVLFFLLMSIAFPLVITIFNFKIIIHDKSFQLAWINFFISIIYAYLLAEQSDMASANFDWNPMIAIFLLFTISVPVFLSMIKVEALTFADTVRKITGSSLLLLHVLCGIGFLYYSTITPFLVR